MSVKPGKSVSAWVDPDDAPEWSDAMFSRAELAESGEVPRPATGTVRDAAVRVLKRQSAKSPFVSIRTFSPVSRAPALVGRTG